MYLALIARPVLHTVVQVAEFVFDRLIRQPLHALAEIGEAVALLLPDLAEASVAAVVQAISAQLSTAGRARVAHGLRKLRRAVQPLAWPVGLGIVLLFWQLRSVFVLLSLLVVLLVMTAGSTAPTGYVTPAPQGASSAGM